MEPDPKGGKLRKVPYYPKSGRKASFTNPDTWADMATAQAARDKYNYSGIGYVFVEESGVVGVDIDHCIDEQGQLNDCARAIVEQFPTYTEISPSGTSLHLFYHGTMPGKGNKNSTSGVEMYATARYFTMTGQQLAGSPDEIWDGAEALPWIHGAFIAKAKKGKKPKQAKRAAFLMSDEELMEKVQASDNGEDFMALYNGQWEGRFGSQSEADMSLCCSLAFWSGKNPEQMDLYSRRKISLFSETGFPYFRKDISALSERLLRDELFVTQRVSSKQGEKGCRVIVPMIFKASTPPLQYALMVEITVGSDAPVLPPIASYVSLGYYKELGFDAYTYGYGTYVRWDFDERN